MAIVLVHGFHPFAEDGGLYAAGIEYKLDPALFPYDRAFVTEHLRFSVFAPCVALLVRSTHLPLQAVLFLLALLAAFFTLFSAHVLLRRCTSNERGQRAGVMVLAAGWTLPVAGTSLYLMDPYVTARSFTLPLSLLALSFALETWERSSADSRLHRPGVRCVLCLMLAAAFHPLMAAMAALFVAAIRATLSWRPAFAWLLLVAATVFFCFAVQTLSQPESAAEQTAVLTRYYWFLSQWRWFEWLGLLGPMVMLGIVLRSYTAALSSSVRVLCRASISLGLFCTAITLLFARESLANHALARLQPLRTFVLFYAVMLLLLGTALYQACERAFARTHRRYLRAVSPLAAAAMAFCLYLTARSTYPSSPHVEWPGQSISDQNPWVQAFLWTRENTPHDALFALDARYVNTPGEDAQVFRAISLRSALPDYSKDGGVASIAPHLAPGWLAASNEEDLSLLDDNERDRRLAPFGVTWMLLHASARTAHPCPYQNGTVKVCRFQP